MFAGELKGITRRVDTGEYLYGRKWSFCGLLLSRRLAVDMLNWLRGGRTAIRWLSRVGGKRVSNV